MEFKVRVWVHLQEMNVSPCNVPHCDGKNNSLSVCVCVHVCLCLCKGFKVAVISRDNSRLERLRSSVSPTTKDNLTTIVGNVGESRSSLVNYFRLLL